MGMNSRKSPHETAVQNGFAKQSSYFQTLNHNFIHFAPKISTGIQKANITNFITLQNETI